MSAGPLAAPAAGRQKRARSKPHPYVRGAYDRLLSVPEHADPSTLRGVTFEVSESGLSLIATELTASGARPRHLIHAFPYYVDIRLPDGREIQIEARVFDADPEPPTAKSSGGKGKQAPGAAPAVLPPAGPPRRRASLYSFTEKEGS